MDEVGTAGTEVAMTLGSGTGMSVESGTAGIGVSVGRTGTEEIEGRSVGRTLGRTLGMALGKPLGRTVGRTVEKPLGRLMLGTLGMERVVPFNPREGRVPLKAEPKRGKMSKSTPLKLERR